MPQAREKVITPALKVPPHNNEAEQAILAGILINNDATNQVMDVLKAEDFYREAHARLFEGMVALYNDNEPSTSSPSPNTSPKRGSSTAPGERNISLPW